MPGMEFEYDEKGGTFYYFLLSFLAFILVPATYYFWPFSNKAKEDLSKSSCHCSPCRMKASNLKDTEPKFKKPLVILLMFIGWGIFFAVAHKASKVEIDYTEFDPYQELGIDRGATVGEIKKAYRKLSLIHHPDKDGDPVKFMKITKAHLALTDDEARQNWETYGNPDGPGATHFGIALPKWIVEKQNSVWVLAAYGLVFMIILPVVVGTWWYRSIKYSAEQILMDTTQLYYYLFNKTSNMPLKRVIMILGASFEFEKGHNGEIVERPSDNEELPQLMRELKQLNEKSKEKPLCYPYSMKARVLLHAHLSGHDLPPKTLEKDLEYILKKCPYLINEMVNIVAQLVALAHAGKVSQVPRLETIENVMRLSQMIIQGSWDRGVSPLSQLPYLQHSHFYDKRKKKKMVTSIQKFAAMPDAERRRVCNLEDHMYNDVMNVCGSMPLVTMRITSKVLDDDDTSITAGSIVTVDVSLERENLSVMFPENMKARENSRLDKMQVEELSPKHVKQEKKSNSQQSNPEKKAISDKEKTEDQKPSSLTKTQTKTLTKTQSKSNADDGAKDSDCSDIDSEDGDFDDENAWMKFQEESKKDNVLETKSKQTHAVHCPYFPIEKHEWWWVYVADSRSHNLITAPVQVCSLKSTEEVQLKFSAPPKPGNYVYTVTLRSDSYLDFDQHKDIRLDVKQAKKMEHHPQWDITDDEDEDKELDNDGSDSDESSNYEDSD